MSTLFKIGDVVKLEKGMKISTMIPSHFEYSTILVYDINTEIIIGESLVSKKTTKGQYLKEFSDYIARFFPKELEAKIKDKELLAFVDSLNLQVTYGSSENPEILDTSKFAGEYLVSNISVLESIVYFDADDHGYEEFEEFEYEEVPINTEIPPYMCTLHCQKVDDPQIKVWFVQSDYDNYFLGK